MIKYRRIYDDEEFDEDEIWDAVEDEIQPNDIEEAMIGFSFMTLFKHLDEEMQTMIWEQARQNVFEECFFEVEEDEENV